MSKNKQDRYPKNTPSKWPHNQRLKNQLIEISKQSCYVWYTLLLLIVMLPRTRWGSVDNVEAKHRDTQPYQEKVFRKCFAKELAQRDKASDESAS